MVSANALYLQVLFTHSYLMLYVGLLTGAIETERLGGTKAPQDEDHPRGNENFSLNHMLLYLFPDCNGKLDSLPPFVCILINHFACRSH